MNKQRVPITTTIPVTLHQVMSGDDTGIKAVTLYYDDSVVYAMNEDAAARYIFAHGTPISWRDGDTEKKNSVFVKRDDATLTITVKPNTLTWTNGKATLYFEAKPGVTPPPPLDPVVDNGGTPPH